MEENSQIKNTISHTPNENAVNQKTLTSKDKISLSSTNQNPTKSARISAHSLRWTWTFKGKTERKPDKLRRMRNWTGKIYYFKRCTVILNVNTMELYTRSRPYTSTNRMISANWSKADLTARQFSEFAQIAITPIHSEHPMDIAGAHLVINEKHINKRLLPGKANTSERRRFIGKNEPYQSAVRVGAIEDGSHPGKVELVGKESVEGGLGLDWLLLTHPKAHETLDARLEKVVIALEKLTEIAQEIKVRMDLEAKK